MKEDRSQEERFDQALREWAARPPRRSPAEAAQAVAAAVAARPAHRRLAVGLAAACVLAVGAVLAVRGLHSNRVAREAGTVLAAPVLRDGQVLIWLDHETPLYMTFAAPGNGAR